jgi:hypothetical protein
MAAAAFRDVEAATLARDGIRAASGNGVHGGENA